jgi:hypothetical protein
MSEAISLLKVEFVFVFKHSVKKSEEIFDLPASTAVECRLQIKNYRLKNKYPA